jgi:hypothetical protein
MPLYTLQTCAKPQYAPCISANPQDTLCISANPQAPKLPQSPFVSLRGGNAMSPVPRANKSILLLAPLPLFVTLGSRELRALSTASATSPNPAALPGAASAGWLAARFIFCTRLLPPWLMALPS